MEEKDTIITIRFSSKEYAQLLEVVEVRGLNRSWRNRKKNKSAVIKDLIFSEYLKVRKGE